MNYRQQRRTKARTNTLISQNHIFWTLIILIGFFVLFYAFFINATVLKTVGLQDVEENIVDTRSEISQLEFKLIDENKNFTKEYAYNIGLVEISNPVFVAKNSATLSFND